MRKFSLLLLVLALCLSFFTPTTQVSAQDDTSFADQGQSNQSSEVDECAGSFLGLPSWHRYLNKNDDCDVVGPRVYPQTGRAVDMSVPANEQVGDFDWQRAAGYIAIAVLEVLIRIGALVAVGFVMYGGFRFITSQGDPEGAKNARNTIINAVIGLVITIASASIVAFIANRLTASDASTPDSGSGDTTSIVLNRV